MIAASEARGNDAVAFGRKVPRRLQVRPRRHRCGSPMTSLPASYARCFLGPVWCRSEEGIAAGTAAAGRLAYDPL
jgi:hypothetical protein